MSTPRAPRTLTLGLVQEAWHADPALHAAALTKGARQAVERGAQLICLQELSCHRYFGDVRSRKLFGLAEPLQGGPTGVLCARIARETRAWVVGSIFERGPDGHFFNTAVIYNGDGELAFHTRKQHIPRGTGYHEDFYFEPGDSDYPVHDLGIVKLAVPTCYDQWFPELARIYALKGAELVVYPTAIGSEPDHPGFDTQPMWQTMMRSHAIANGLFIAAINRTGHEGLVRFYGSSFVCEPTGQVLAQAPRNEPAVVVATLDFAIQIFWRTLFPLLEQRQPTTYGRLTK